MAGLIFGLGVVFLVAPGQDGVSYGRRFSDQFRGRRQSDRARAVGQAPAPTIPPDGIERRGNVANRTAVSIHSDSDSSTSISAEIQRGAIPQSPLAGFQVPPSDPTQASHVSADVDRRRTQATDQRTERRRI